MFEFGIFILSGTLVFLGVKIFLYLVENEKILVRGKGAETIVKPCMKELHKNKKKTPIMGGIVMNISLIIFTLIYWIMFKEVIWINIAAATFGALGFVDDYIKIKKPQDGLTPRKKLINALILSLVWSIFIGGGKGVLFIVISTFFITASTNSFNITDGLDGLLLGISIIVFSFIGVCAYFKGDVEIVTTAVVVLGGCFGTFFFNRNPARVFIGDTGSFFLGALACLCFIRMDMLFFIVVSAGVCFFESFSSAIQMASLKFRKKKVFLIAPYHHHLEKKGLNEKNIVKLFWGVSLILNIAAFTAFKYYFPCF